jgi:cytochrome c oxidase subunit 2
MWNFEYTNGRKTLNTMFLPVGKQVRLLMTSEDVLHSFFVPNFRTKQDVVPGMFTKLDFKITETGVHPIYCAEFCGTGHSDMLGVVVAMEPEVYEKWLLTGKVPANYQTLIDKNPPAGIIAQSSTAKGSDSNSNAGTPGVEKGKALFTAKACFGCHSTDGSPKVGPSLKGVFGKEEELQSGEKVKVDENYLKESMLNPAAKVVKGFAPSMPPLQLSDQEMSDLIAYIKSLK